MQPYFDDGKWMIVRNIRTIDANGISGTRGHYANRVRVTYECWTGEKWVQQRAYARSFTTEDEANQYLAEHWNQLAEVQG